MLEIGSMEADEFGILCISMIEPAAVALALFFGPSGSRSRWQLATVAGRCGEWREAFFGCGA